MNSITDKEEAAAENTPDLSNEEPLDLDYLERVERNLPEPDLSDPEILETVKRGIAEYEKVLADQFYDNRYAFDGTGYIEVAGTNDNMHSGDTKDWNELWIGSDGYDYPAGFTRRHGAAPECDHEYETKYLFTSHYDVCTKCGKEKEEQAGKK